MTSDDVWYFLASQYARLYVSCHRRIGINLRGLGWLLRKLTSDRVIQTKGVNFQLVNGLASAYSCMLAGEWNEPETHRFLRHITASVDAPLCFVDIGANIGAIALDAARLPGIRSVIAVEPDRRCVAAIEASCRLNGFTNVSVVSAAVSSKPGPVQFIADEHSFLSHVERRPESGADLYATWVAGLTLDGISADITDASIVLIDVEGSELDVLSGGIQFIRRLKPLIIFEYNRISRAHFDLEQVRSVLGPEYEIFRLNHNGRLDRELEVTWNCCAISKDTVFHERLSSFVES